MFDHDETRWLGAAGGDGQQAAHLLALDRRLVEDLDLQRTVRLGQVTGLAGQVARCADVAGQIAQVAQQAHALGHGRAMRKATARCDGPFGRHGTCQHLGQGRRAWLAAGFQVVGTIQRSLCQLRHGAAEVVVIQVHADRTVDAQRQARGASAQYGSQCRGHGLAPGAAIESAGRAQAHDDDAGGLGPRQVHQQLRVTQSRR